jgi:hypothetical protein
VRTPSVDALALAALLALPASVRAQTVVFQDSFEAGLGAWTATGLWNLENAGDPCGASFGPFPDGAQVAWYGQAGACTYDTPGTPSSGTLSTNDWIDLPPGPASISLRYRASSRTEDCGEGYDWMAVRIEAQNGPDAGFTATYCGVAPGIAILDAAWHERRIDLSAYRGARIRIAFEFATLDELQNGYLGWLVDDVRVLAEPGVRTCPPAVASGCPCAANWPPISGGCRNSVGGSACLLSEGVASLAADTLRFRAASVPASANVLLVQGDAAIAPVAFGDGVRCVGGGQIRLGTQTASGGAASWPPPGAGPISVLGQITLPGSTRTYTALYRDVAPFCTAATFNLTDAQRVDWAP